MRKMERVRFGRGGIGRGVSTGGNSSSTEVDGLLRWTHQTDPDLPAFPHEHDSQGSAADAQAGTLKERARLRGAADIVEGVECLVAGG